MSSAVNKFRRGAAALAVITAAGMAPAIAQADPTDAPAPSPVGGNSAGQTAGPGLGTAAGQPRNAGAAEGGATANGPRSRADAGASAAATDPVFVEPTPAGTNPADPNAVIVNPPNGYGPAPTPVITDFQPLPTWLGQAGSQPCQIIVGPYGTTKKGSCSSE